MKTNSLDWEFIMVVLDYNRFTQCITAAIIR